MAVGDTGVEISMGNGVGVAEGAALVGVDGFVGFDFRTSFVGEGSTSTLAATLASGLSTI